MGIVVRFVIGNSPNERAQAALDQEAAAYGDIMRLQLEVGAHVRRWSC